LLVVAAGCGRIGFDRFGPGGADDGGGGSDSTLIAPDALPTGLVAWFPLEALPAADLVGGGSGTCVAPTCPAAISGPHGGAMHFDGSDDCLTIADYPVLHQGAITIGVWEQADVAQDTADFSKRVDIAAGSYDTWELGGGATNELTLTTVHGPSSEQFATATDLLVPGVWQHIAFTWDGATARVYIDGSERAMQASASALTYDANNAYIGCDDNGGGPTRFFIGALDDLQIYDRALSATQIQDLAAM
jgi:hypothetical protein